MIRTASIALLGFAFVLSVVGCGTKEPPKPDMPIKTSGGPGDKGKKSKVIEAALEDPGAKK